MFRRAAAILFAITVLTVQTPWRVTAQMVAEPMPPLPEGSQQPSAASLGDTLSGPARSEYDSGRILFADRDYAGALLKFQRAFEHTPDVRLLWNMAACEKNLRHYGSALELLERYRREGELQMSVSHRAEVTNVVNTLRTLVSTVHLTVNEADAEVFVDDRKAGVTPLPRPLFVDLGLRRIRVRKAGFQDLVITQEFSGGSELTLLLTMAVEPKEGDLAIVSDDGATIRIDGQIVGRGHWQGALPAGEHTVRVTAPDMIPYAKAVEIQAGQARTIYAQLDPDESGGIPAWLWVGAGVVAAGGLATGAYFLLREPSGADHTTGTWTPGVVHIPLRTR
jgi:hypothetical protein